MAYVFQRFVRRALEGSASKISPSDVFNGPLFHAALHEVRQGGGVDDDDDDEDDAAENVAGALPIDAHRDEILAHVRKHRVTVVVGETGCGKSSRLPLMLMQQPGVKRPKMMVSQPRRIAARALCSRVRKMPGCAGLVGLRLGHGEKDEAPGTRLWFVTAGYLVRLLASYPASFNDHTHLIVDEVHERSVDTDVLCLLVRRLVATNPKIRVVLMSATLCAELLRDYFELASPHIFVGARRFVNEMFYADELAEGALRWPMKLKQRAAQLAHSTSSGSFKDLSNQADLAVAIVTSVGTPTSAILIFVPGMAEILDLSEKLEAVSFGGKRAGTSPLTYRAIPIHSDIPDEDQMAVFGSLEPNEVKVVIATNAAESSLTIPDVDHVICLGTHKTIEYNEATHRQLLTKAWISKSSATQRAGRTGRVRPGCVYRLYSRACHDVHFQEFETGELHRVPLDQVVLQLRTLLADEPSIAAVLADTLEPPNAAHVLRSFASLYELDLFDSPRDEEARLTSMGSFVGQLGVDIASGRMIGLGAQIGVLPEAVALAGCLSQPRDPFRIAHPLVHTKAEEFNDVTAAVLISRSKFDQGVYSEPIALANLLFCFDGARDQRQFASKHALAIARMRDLSRQVKHLRSRVEGVLKSDIKPLANPMRNSQTINRLRLLLTWTAQGNLVVADGGKVPLANTPLRVPLSGPPLESSRFLSQLPECLRDKLSLVGSVRSQFTRPASSEECAALAGLAEDPSELLESAFSTRQCDAAWLIVQPFKAKPVVRLFATRNGLDACASCGIVDLDDFDEPDLIHGTHGTPLFRVDGEVTKGLKRALASLLDNIGGGGALCVRATENQFYAATSGFTPSTPELNRLFLVPPAAARPFSRQTSSNQAFDCVPEKEECEAAVPRLFEDLPLGARALSALSNGQRDRTLHLPATASADVPGDSARAIADEGPHLSFSIKVPSRKFRIAPLSMNQAPSSSGNIIMSGLARCAVPCARAEDNEQKRLAKRRLWGVAANMLDLKGGSAVAEQVTLLPSGAWLAKALLCFDVELSDFAMAELLDDEEDDSLGDDTFDAVVAIVESARQVYEATTYQPELTNQIDAVFGFARETCTRDATRAQSAQRPLEEPKAETGAKKQRTRRKKKKSREA